MGAVQTGKYIQHQCSVGGRANNYSLPLAENSVAGRSLETCAEDGDQMCSLAIFHSHDKDSSIGSQFSRSVPCILTNAHNVPVGLHSGQSYSQLSSQIERPAWWSLKKTFCVLLSVWLLPFQAAAKLVFLSLEILNALRESQDV